MELYGSVIFCNFRGKIYKEYEKAINPMCRFNFMFCFN